MCVFIPAAFMGGLSGAYYRQFGLTMAVAVAISTFCALTLCPALCALLMKPRSPEAELQTASWSVRFRHAYNKAFNALLAKYSRALGWFTGRRWLVGALTAVSIVLVGWMLYTTPTGLVPDEDTGILFVDITTPAGSTLAHTQKTVKEMSEFLEALGRPPGGRSRHFQHLRPYRGCHSSGKEWFDVRVPAPHCLWL